MDISVPYDPFVPYKTVSLVTDPTRVTVTYVLNPRQSLLLLSQITHRSIVTTWMYPTLYLPFTLLPLSGTDTVEFSVKTPHTWSFPPSVSSYTPLLPSNVRSYTFRTHVHLQLHSPSLTSTWPRKCGVLLWISEPYPLPTRKDNILPSSPSISSKTSV